MFHGLPSLEMIDYQKNSSLGMDIEIALTKLRELTTVSDTDVVSSKIENVIRKNTNLDIRVKIDPKKSYNASVFVPDIDINNAVVNRYRKEFLTGSDADVLIGKNMYSIGTVDLARSRVGGDFTKLATIILVAPDLLYKQSALTVREVTGIILHEIGHVFSYLEMLGRTVTTNFVLEEANRRLLNIVDKDRKYKIIKEIEDESGIKFKETNTLASVKDEAAMTTVIISEVINKSYAELGANIYDERTFEMMADQFATRHGYGKDIVTGFDKIYRGLNPEMYFNSGKRMRIKAGIILANILYTPALPVVFILTALSTEKRLQAYDKPKKRLEVVRNDINRQLKEPNLTQEEKISILNDLEVINKLLSEMTDDSYYVFNWVTQFMLRKNNRVINIQQSLEQLANSKLNESLARLKMLESNHA